MDLIKLLRSFVRTKTDKPAPGKAPPAKDRGIPVPGRPPADVEQFAADVLAGRRPRDPRGDFGTPNNPHEKGEEREKFGGDLLSDFLDRGLVLHVQSSWVEYGRYDAPASELEVGFQDGFTAVYGPVSRAVAESFAKAPSKGKWLHTNIKVGYQADGKHWVHATSFRAK